MSSTGFDEYAKESYNLSRERVPVFTQVSSDPDVKLNFEFAFKGKVNLTTLNPPKGIKFQWAPKR